MKKQPIPYARKRNPRSRFEAWMFEKYGTQTNLARELGITHQSINNWLTGVNLPSTPLIRRIWEISRDEITPNYWFFELPEEIKLYRMSEALHEPSDA